MKADKPSSFSWKKLHHEIPVPVRKLGGCESLLTKCSRGNGTNPRQEELSCSCDALFLSSGQQPCAQPFWMRLMRWDILALAVKPHTCCYSPGRGPQPRCAFGEGNGVLGEALKTQLVAAVTTVQPHIDIIYVL